MRGHTSVSIYFDVRTIKLETFKIHTFKIKMGRDSSVGIAARYRLDGPGIESRRGGAIFRTRPERPSDTPNLLHNGYRVSFPRVKRPWRRIDHPPFSKAKVKEKGELYCTPTVDLRGMFWGEIYI